MKMVFPFAALMAWAMLAQPALAAMDEDARRDASNKIAGKRQYLEFCASCHGDTGGGNGPLAQRGTVPDFTTPQAVVKFDLERMSAAIEKKHDQKTRDSWKSRLAEDGAHIISFMREAFMLPAPTADASPGRAIYARTCSVCHGERGNGASWAKNSLNPSPADFTAPKVRELSRRHMINTVTYGSPKTAMQGFSTRLSREEIAAVVDYVRSTFMAPGSIPGEGNQAPATLSYGNRMMSSQGHHEGEGKHAEHGGHDGPADMDAPLPNGLAGNAVTGKEFFDKNCFVCHGKEGQGDGPRAYFIVPKPANLTSVEARVELNRPHLFTAIAKGSQGTEMPAWSKVLSDQEIADVAEYVFVAFIQPSGQPTPKQPDNGAAGQPEAQKKNN